MCPGLRDLISCGVMWTKNRVWTLKSESGRDVAVLFFPNVPILQWWYCKYHWENHSKWSFECASNFQKLKIFRIKKPKILTFHHGNCVEAPRFMSFEAAVSRFGVVIIIIVIFLVAPRRFCLHEREKRSALIIGKAKVGNSLAYFYFTFYIVAAFNGFRDDRYHI